ncbi:hypothetical protein [Petrimonas sp.]|jgi:hypothetical protein|uniref:hypothetical protein n=1 Tax=Petrimonas sp. TaxID=2023866 RepID=UPI003332D5FB
MADNDKLKMKFKLHQLEFELEGNQEVVKEQFDSFKSFITNDLLPKINVSTLQEPAAQPDKQTKELPAAQEFTTIEEIEDMPDLKEIVMLHLANSETDWVLLYAYYATSFGKTTFTIEDIKNSYTKTGRTKKSYFTNLSNNIKSILNKRYIKVHNDTEFLIRPEGIKYANEILMGKSNSTTINKSTNSKTSSSKQNNTVKNKPAGNQFSLDRSLNLRPDGIESLKDFAAKYQFDSTPKQIVVIVYYLKEILKLSNINGNHIYSGLDELDVRIPKSLYQIIANTKSRDGWLDYDSMDDIGLSMQGRNAIKHDLIIK